MLISLKAGLNCCLPFHNTRYRKLALRVAEKLQFDERSRSTHRGWEQWTVYFSVDFNNGFLWERISAVLLHRPVKANYATFISHGWTMRSMQWFPTWRSGSSKKDPKEGLRGGHKMMWRQLFLSLMFVFSLWLFQVTENPSNKTIQDRESFFDWSHK